MDYSIGVESYPVYFDNTLSTYPIDKLEQKYKKNAVKRRFYNGSAVI